MNTKTRTELTGGNHCPPPTGNYLKSALTLWAVIAIPLLGGLIYSPLLGTDIAGHLLRTTVIQWSVLAQTELFCIWLPLNAFERRHWLIRMLPYMIMVLCTFTVGLAAGAPPIQWPS